MLQKSPELTMPGKPNQLETAKNECEPGIGISKVIFGINVPGLWEARSNDRCRLECST